MATEFTITFGSDFEEAVQRLARHEIEYGDTVREEVESAIENIDFDDKIADALAEVDWDDKMRDAIDSAIDDIDFDDKIRDALRYTDVSDWFDVDFPTSGDFEEAIDKLNARIAALEATMTRLAQALTPPVPTPEPEPQPEPQVTFTIVPEEPVTYEHDVERDGDAKLKDAIQMLANALYPDATDE